MYFYSSFYYVSEAHWSNAFGMNSVLVKPKQILKCFEATLQKTPALPVWATLNELNLDIWNVQKMKVILTLALSSDTHQFYSAIN